MRKQEFLDSLEQLLWDLKEEDRREAMQYYIDYFEDAGILVSGDTLFQESVGRTDLPTGSGGTLMRSIKERLLCLPGETKVYPGHGDSTTISYEGKYNPFC